MSLNTQLLILVGQSRSGSTLLTRLMNDGHRAAVINDAYIVQLADELSGRPEIAPAQVDRLTSEWLNIIRRRSEPQAPASIHKSLVLKPEIFAELVRETEAQRGDWQTWPEAVAGPLEILTRLLGATAPGWNTPPDYAYAERLLQLFPGSKIVFLIRDPLAVLLSYKRLPDYWGDEKNRYNPAIQALVWRKMVNHYNQTAAHFPERVHLVRYEDLVADPVATMARLGQFCGTVFTTPDLARLGNNSSFADKTTGGLSRIECWVCETLTGPSRIVQGYGQSAVPRLSSWGVGNFLTYCWRSSHFYGGKFLRSRDIRLRIMRFAKLLFLNR